MVPYGYMLEPEIETMSRDRLKELQDRRLRNAVRRCYEKMQLYKDKFEEAGIRPEDVETADDLHKIPFTTKDDLRSRYPMNGLLAVPRDQISRIHMTTGTTGQPTVSPLTKDDIYREEVVLAKCGSALGVGPGDTIQLMFGYGLFAGSVLAQPAFEKILGASIIPTGAAVPSATQLDIMKDFRPSVVAATPSFFLHIIEVAKEKGIDLADLGIRGIMTGAEPSSEETRLKISMAFGEAAYIDIYGLCELGPHFSFECQEHQGMHFCQEAFIPEIIDPETGATLGPGEPGMLVVSCLMKEAMPILRYQTKDITVIDDEPCACGRTQIRIRRPTGRTDDMIKVKGVNVFPSQIEAIVRKTQEVKDSEFQILVDRSEKAVDMLTVKIEAHEKTTELVQKLKAEFQRAFMGSNFKVELVEWGTLPRFTHKAKRLVDTRKL
jgi:phenylacetate-CoA ligase